MVALMLSSGPSGDHRYERGAFCWVGLATSDPVAARCFYASLFGWQGEELRASETGSFVLLRRDGRAAALLYPQMLEARAAAAPPHWTSFVSVDDADAAARRAVELGGAPVAHGPFDVPGQGRIAAVRDPTGAIVSLWESRGANGAAPTDEIGGLFGHELATTGLELAKAFYGDLFGWEYETDARGYTEIWNGERRNGGIREQADPERPAQPAWLPYFGVPSREGATRRAMWVGGRAVPPNGDLLIAGSAVITDPLGARFGIVECDRAAA